MDQTNNAIIKEMWQRILDLERKQNADKNELEQRLSIVESRSSSTAIIKESSNQASKDASKMVYQLAEDITAVVGLKEALTWRHKWLRCVWAIALCAGIVATLFFLVASTSEYTDDPTATKVKLISNQTYEYPEIYLCPDVWLNASKALSLGLSLEGLKFSLGYINNEGDKVGPDDSETAMKAFFTFFNNSNFSTFNDYLLEVAVDIPVEQSIERFSNRNTTLALCPRCGSSIPLKKAFKDTGVCYSFKLRPETGRGRLATISRDVSIKLNDLSMNLIKTSLWRVEFDPILKIRKRVGAPVYFLSNTFGRITIRPQTSILLNTDETPCLSSSAKDYSSVACVSQCFAPLYFSILDCIPFEASVKGFDYHPTKLCNYFEQANESWWAVDQVFAEQREAVRELPEAKQCYKKCNYNCARTTYQQYKQMTFTSSDLSSSVTGAFSPDDMIFLHVIIEHAALYEGGIMTMKEVSTFSFTTLISNVGGTLGLFVGGTMMTFVQVVLFFARHFLDNRKNRQIAPNANGFSDTVGL